MNALKDMNKKFIIIILIIMFSFIFVHIVQAVTAEPGSDEDPIVTKGYVDQRINELLSKIDDLAILIDDFSKKIKGLTTNDNALAEKVSDLMVKEDELSTKVSDLSIMLEDISGQVNNEDIQAGLKFKIIELAKGKQLVAGESTEIIVRAGTAKAVGSESGGLADFTAGKDIQSGGLIPLNHFLLVPRDDGRGLKANTKIVILIKGTYSIK